MELINVNLYRTPLENGSLQIEDKSLTEKFCIFLDEKLNFTNNIQAMAKPLRAIVLSICTIAEIFLHLIEFAFSFASLAALPILVMIDVFRNFGKDNKINLKENLMLIVTRVVMNAAAIVFEVPRLFENHFHDGPQVTRS
jgi:hypothetical protein